MLGMTIDDLLVHGRNLVERHWSQIALTLLGLWFGAWWARRRAARQWQRKEFIDRLNVSLNIIADGKLQIRTILEGSHEEIFLNRIAIDKIQHAARRTTEANPLLTLDQDDNWFLLNAVLNEVSEKLAEGHVRRDMGLPTHTQRYVLALTYECAGAMRTRKVRAMMIKQSTLLNLPQEMPLLEHERHQTRFQTLQVIAAEYARQPGRFLELEVSL
ncbi:MAG TPA: hypothetical protein VHV55_01005 [Pirellulales bacterium]|jgi:hypothetical protein|nr:hypothetical protein [Pirellulales bacterium]